MELKMYVGIVTDDITMRVELFTETNFVDLAKEITSYVWKRYPNYIPELQQIIIPNSIDFVMDSDEELYRQNLIDISSIFSSKGFLLNINLYEVDQIIDQTEMVSIENNEI